jgi:hypothetical protein
LCPQIKDKEVSPRDELTDQLLRLTTGKSIGATFPGFLLLLGTYMVKGQLDRFAAKIDPALALLIYVSLYFEILIVTVLVYIVRLLVRELGRKSEYTADLEKAFIKQRKTTAEEEEEDEA